MIVRDVRDMVPNDLISHDSNDSGGTNDSNGTSDSDDSDTNSSNASDFSTNNKKKNPLVFMTVGTRNGVIGKIVFELFADVVPKTARNFATLCDKPKGQGYNGCTFHRIIPGFMIQGGDFEFGNGKGGSSIYGRTFPDENFRIKHKGPGLLSMANSGPDTNGSQFFVTLDNTSHLDGKHVVFGKVVKGIDVINRIAKLGSDDGSPRETVKIVDCGSL